MVCERVAGDLVPLIVQLVQQGAVCRDNGQRKGRERQLGGRACALLIMGLMTKAFGAAPPPSAAMRGRAHRCRG